MIESKLREWGNWAMDRSDTLQHILSQSRPVFLGMLDSDPHGAFRKFYDFTWRLLTISPPTVMRHLDSDTRQDFISEILLHFWSNDQRVLRRYEDQGRPFAKWFLVVAHRKAIDLLRQPAISSVPIDPAPDHDAGTVSIQLSNPDPSPLRVAISAEHLRIVRGLIKELRPECQILLRCRELGMKPQEIIELLALPSHENKSVSDKARACANELKKRMKSAGYDWRDFISVDPELKPDTVAE